MKSEKIYNILVAVACTFTTISCNRDVFIDSGDLPTHTEASVEGDGGEWSAVYSRKGLIRVYIDCSDSEKQYITCYGEHGEVDPDSEASKIKEINFENPVRWYSFGFIDSMIYFRSIYNASSSYKVRLFLEYEGGVTKQITLSLTEGTPLKTVYYFYIGNMEIEEDIDQITRRTGFVNNSSLPQRLEIMPFSEANCSDEIQALDQWANGLELTLPMLVYDGSQWQLKEFDNIRIGERRSFLTEEYDDTKISVTVPPNTTARVTYTLHYSRNRTRGEISFYNAETDYTYKTEVLWTAVYATRFNYKVDFE